MTSEERNEMDMSSFTSDPTFPSQLIADFTEESRPSAIEGHSHLILSPHRRHSLSDLLSFSEHAAVPTLKKPCRSFDCLTDNNLISGFGVDLRYVGAGGPKELPHPLSDAAITEDALVKSEGKSLLHDPCNVSTASASQGNISRNISGLDLYSESISAVTIKARRKSSTAPSRSSTMSSLPEYPSDEVPVVGSKAFSVGNVVSSSSGKSEQITLYLTRKYSSSQLVGNSNNNSTSDNQVTSTSTTEFSDKSRLELSTSPQPPQEFSVFAAEAKRGTTTADDATSSGNTISLRMTSPEGEFYPGSGGGGVACGLTSILSTDSLPGTVESRRHSSSTANIEELYLENEWVFWTDTSSPASSHHVDSDTSRLVELGSVNTVQGFWTYWNDFMVESWDTARRLCLFKKGIKPTVEDPWNCEGGKWVICNLATKYRVKIWATMALLLIGEQLEFDESRNMVCGVVFTSGNSLKSSTHLDQASFGDSVALWMDGGYSSRLNKNKPSLPASGKSMYQVVEQYFHEEINLSTLQYIRHSSLISAIAPGTTLVVSPQHYQLPGEADSSILMAPFHSLSTAQFPPPYSHSQSNISPKGASLLSNPSMKNPFPNSTQHYSNSEAVSNDFSVMISDTVSARKLQDTSMLASDVVAPPPVVNLQAYSGQTQHILQQQQPQPQPQPQPYISEGLLPPNPVVKPPASVVWPTTTKPGIMFTGNEMTKRPTTTTTTTTISQALSHYRQPVLLSGGGNWQSSGQAEQQTEHQDSIDSSCSMEHSSEKPIFSVPPPALNSWGQGNSDPWKHHQGTALPAAKVESTAVDGGFEVNPAAYKSAAFSSSSSQSSNSGVVAWRDQTSFTSIDPLSGKLAKQSGLENHWQTVKVEQQVLQHKLEQINYLLDIYERVRSAPVDSTFVVSDILTSNGGISLPASATEESRSVSHSLRQPQADTSYGNYSERGGDQSLPQNYFRDNSNNRNNPNAGKNLWNKKRRQ